MPAGLKSFSFLERNVFPGGSWRPLGGERKKEVIMTQEEKQLLIKDLCARLPYGVNILADIDKEFDGGAIGELLGIIPHTGIEGELLFYQKGCLTPLSIEEIRPYLRPMSSMTEDEEEERNNIVLFHSGNIASVPTYIDFLNKHHFDYRGLIEKRLALEALDGMYKTE